MQFSDIISVDRIECEASTVSKKRTLEFISQLITANSDELDKMEVFDSLIAREKLGSTGLGHGIAIPHGRLKNGNKTIAAFLQLKDGVDFDAPDGENVDLLCALLVPAVCSDEHLQVLAYLSEIFSEAELREKLRAAHSADEILTLLTQYKPQEN